MEQETRTTLTKTEKQLCITTGSMVHVGTSQASAPFESSTATRQQQEQQSATTTEQMASSSDPPLVAEATRLSFTNPLSGESLFDMDYHKGDDIMQQVSLKLAMSTSLFSLACGDVPLTGEGSDIMDGSMISIIFQKPTCDDDNDEPKLYIGESTCHIYKFTYHEKVIWTGTFCGAEWSEEVMWDMPGGQDGMWPWAEDIFQDGNDGILQVCLDGVCISIDDLTNKLAEMTESATIDFMIDDAFELDWGEAEPGFPLQHSPSEPDN